MTEINTQLTTSQGPKLHLGGVEVVEDPTF
jgi:hypothetical protein